MVRGPLASLATTLSSWDGVFVSGVIWVSLLHVRRAIIVDAPRAPRGAVDDVLVRNVVVHRAGQPS